jgi:hypothetical protein
MPRPRFTLKSMLWVTIVVAAFFAGAFWQKRKMIADGWSEPWPFPLFKLRQSSGTQE